MKSLLLSLSVLFLTLSTLSQAHAEYTDFDPTAPDALEQLHQMDMQYLSETGLDPNLAYNPNAPQTCYREKCVVYININRAEQMMRVYLNGSLEYEFPTSTGKAGFETPDFDTNPNGRVYRIYSSTKYPGYNNMPYAIFIWGGYAIHGAPGAAEAKLGQPASHGCIRIALPNAQLLNELVRAAIDYAGGSTREVWVTVE